MSQSMQELWDSAHISAGHSSYLESLYEVFLINPEELPKEWSDFFLNLPAESIGSEISHKRIIEEFKNFSRASSQPNEEIDERQGKVIRLIQAYRNRGIILKHRGDTFSACKDWKKANELGDKDMKNWLSSYCSEVSFKF